MEAGGCHAGTTLVVSFATSSEDVMIPPYRQGEIVVILISGSCPPSSFDSEVVDMLQVDKLVHSMTEEHSVDLSGGLEDVPVLCEALTPPTFKYSTDNVQGAGCSLDPSEVTLPGCSCTSHSCHPETCSCLQTSGKAYDDTGRLLNLDGPESGYSSPVFECNALCSCSDTCSNRVVGRGLRLRLVVYRTKSKGWGVRTLEEIPRGRFVCEYAGEVITFAEATRRQLSQRVEENNYIIAVREHAGMGSVTETFVDPARAGNVGRFLNHSCAPNLHMLPVRVHSAIPRLALFAGRDIHAQEELTFDYSGRYGAQKPVEGTSSDGLKRKQCHCGSLNCARSLPLDLSILS